MKKIIFLYLIYALEVVYGQILKDTTLPYGVNTTKFYYEEDEKYLRNKRRSVDTTFMQFQNYEGVFTKDNFYQNLGVMGSASRPVFYEVNREIGLDHGYGAFQQYFMDADRHVFFATRSPFSRLSYVQGTTGESKLYVNLASPFTKRSSFGIDIGRYTSRKIAGRTGDKNTDKFVGNFNLAVYFNHLSKNQRYKVFGVSTLVWHNQNENGGFDLSAFKNIYNVFDSLNVSKARFDGLSSNSFTNVYRNDVKIYQNYRLSKDSSLALFHEFAFKRCSTNVFITPNAKNLDSLFFNKDGAYFDSTNTSYSYRFDRLENKIGVAGRLKIIDYVLFAKNRALSGKTLITGKKVKDDTLYRTTIYENYLGGNVKLKLIDEKLYLDLFAEKKLTNHVSGYDADVFKVNLKNDYVIDASVNSGFAKLGFLQKMVSPTAFQTSMYHNNYRWSRKLDTATTSKNIYILADKKIKKQYLGIMLYYSDIKHLYYFDTNRVIAKSSLKSVSLFRTRFTVNLHLWKFHLDNRVEIARSNDQIAYPVPDFIYEPKVYFGSKYKTLNFHVGLEALYVDKFYAYQYNPEINSFSAQNRELSYGVPVVTPFVNGQIQNFSFWLKYSFANQYLNKGYFVSPNYPGLPQTFVFGINWLLYE